MRSYEYVYLACTGTVQRPVVWLYMHLYGIFLAAASFALNMAGLYDLQKLAGKSATVVAGVNVKAVLSSTEKV